MGITEPADGTALRRFRDPLAAVRPILLFIPSKGFRIDHP